MQDNEFSYCLVVFKLDKLPFNLAGIYRTPCSNFDSTIL